jgi:hypothetical protein
MGQFTVSDITNLESPGTREALGVKIGRMIMNSATVQARVEEITFDTGEYAVVLRGVLKPNATLTDPGPQEVSVDPEETKSLPLEMSGRMSD